MQICGPYGCTWLTRKPFSEVVPEKQRCADQTLIPTISGDALLIFALPHFLHTVVPV